MLQFFYRVPEERVVKASVLTWSELHKLTNLEEGVTVGIFANARFVWVE